MVIAPPLGYTLDCQCDREECQECNPPKKKSKGQKRREQRKRAKERKRMARVEADAIGNWDAP